MQDVPALPSKIGATLRDAPPLLLVVVRPMLFSRERPLLALQAVAFVRAVECLDRRAVGVVGVGQDPHVDADAPFELLRGVGWFTIHLDADGDGPLAYRFLLYPALFECRVVLRNRSFLMGCTRATALVNVGDGAVEPYRYIRTSRERQHSPAALLFGLETRPTVGDTAELPGGFHVS